MYRSLPLSTCSNSVADAVASILEWIDESPSKFKPHRNSVFVFRRSFCRCSRIEFNYPYFRQLGRIEIALGTFLKLLSGSSATMIQ